MQTVRDHDLFYLKENRKLTPKEYFKFIVKISKDDLVKLPTPSILDIGCATGDFLYYLSTLYPEAKLTGLDVMDKLLERAREEVAGARFLNGNIAESSTLPKEKFDIIFMNSVHSIWDNYKPWIDNLVQLSKGKIYVFGIFNPEDYDILLKVRPSCRENDPWQVGWNLLSEKTISEYLKKKELPYKFHNWKINIELPRNPTDGLRGWTLRLADGSLQVVNSTQLLQHFYLLEMGPIPQQTS